MTDQPVRAFGPTTRDEALAAQGEDGTAGLEPFASELEDLRAELAAEVKVEDVTIPVPTRNGYAARFRVDVTARELDAWRKQAKDRKRGDGVAGERFAALVLAHTCTAIVRAGKDVTDDGEPLTFRSRPFLDLYGVTRAAEAVARFYGLDSAVDSAARTVLLESGWGDDLDAEAGEGPTRSARS